MGKKIKPFITIYAPVLKGFIYKSYPRFIILYATPIHFIIGLFNRMAHKRKVRLLDALTASLHR